MGAGRADWENMEIMENSAHRQGGQRTENTCRLSSWNMESKENWEIIENMENRGHRLNHGSRESKENRENLENGEHRQGEQIWRELREHGEHWRTENTDQTVGGCRGTELSSVSTGSQRSELAHADSMRGRNGQPDLSAMVKRIPAEQISRAIIGLLFPPFQPFPPFPFLIST